MIIPNDAVFYIERRSDTNVVFQKDAAGRFVRVQKFADFSDAKNYVKDIASKNVFYFYDQTGARVKLDGTPEAE